MPSRNPISYTNTNGTPFNSSSKAFFVSDATGATYNTLCLNYPPDPDGTPRVFTTVTSALAACVTGEGDFIVLSPDFTTALTVTELASAQSKGVMIIQGGQNVGSVWSAMRATANTPQTNTEALFTVTGKVKLVSLIGRVTTPTAATTNTAAIYVQDTSVANLGCTTIAAVGHINSLVCSAFLSITGTFATVVQSSKMAAVYQASPVVISGNSQIKWITTGSTTGKIQWTARYEPLEPGARVIPA